MVYSEADTKPASSIISIFEERKKTIKIMSSKDVAINEDSWQHDMFLAMISSAR